MKRTLVLAISSLTAAQAAALEPAEVFGKVAPSVWAVRGLDATERPITYGSGVVIDKGRLVTNCHVLAKAKAIQVRRSNVAYFGKLEHADVERDLCIISVADFNAPAVEVLPLSSVRVGQRAYAVGNPETLDLTLSEGLISGVRAEDPRVPPVQTSAPISPGSSGGGLFDDQGRLIGITTLSVIGRARIAQNLNFAVPAGWAAEVPERAKEQLAKAHATREARSGGATLAAGVLWASTFRDRLFSNRQREFVVRTTLVDRSSVTEIVSSGNQQRTFLTNTAEIRFQRRRIDGEDVIELAPYLLTRVPTPTMPLADSPRTYPGSGTAQDWRVRVLAVAHEEVSVPAGRFEAYRIQLAGENDQQRFGRGSYNPNMDYVPQRFEYEVWYAPAIGRYVQIHHKTFNRSGKDVSDEWVQLTKFQPAGAAPAK